MGEVWSPDMIQSVDFKFDKYFPDSMVNIFIFTDNVKYMYNLTIN